jgi:hypothetical protein
LNEPFDDQIILNDLRWVCSAPSLLEAHSQIWQPGLLDYDQITAKIDSNHLNSLALARTKKLGGYFEQLVFSLFTLSDDYQVLAFNQVFNNSQRTLGELDLLIKHKSGEVIHLELALKFYLWAESELVSQFNWVGAGLTDFFALKLARLASHQLKISQIAIKQQCWPDLPKPDRSMLWIPGRLFLPEGMALRDTICEFSDSPWRLNPSALTSHWQIDHDLKKHENNALVKGDWLTGYASRPEAAMKRYQLPMQFAGKENSPVFILPGNWQNDAKATIENKQLNYELNCTKPKR